MRFFKNNELMVRVLQIIAVLNISTFLFGLSVYAYGGLFSRYLADDYCEVILLINSKNVFDAVVQAYIKWLNSYSVLIILQLVEWGGKWGVRLFAAVTILLWVLGLTWLISEIAKSIRLRLGLLFALWIAVSVIFLSLYQASNLYQILYWRAAMVPYTLPLVFFIYIAAFILHYAQLPYQKNRAFWVGLVSFGLVFFAAGLGETTTAFEIGLLFVAVLSVWLTKSQHRRMDVLNILLISLVVAVAALLIIAIAPGTQNRLDLVSAKRDPVFNPILLAIRTFVYIFQFIWNAFRTLPLPILVSMIIPFGIIYVLCSNKWDDLSLPSPSQIRVVLLAIPVCVFIAIGFSFAPSAFAQSYPVERARFAAQFIMTLGLAFEGGLLGILASRIHLPANTTSFVRSTVIILLGLLLLYPLNASMRLYPPILRYQQWSVLWDQRDAQIRSLAAQGQTDLMIPQLDGIDGVKELEIYSKYWVNSCASEYYGVNSIRAIPVK